MKSNDWTNRVGKDRDRLNAGKEVKINGERQIAEKGRDKCPAAKDIETCTKDSLPFCDTRTPNYIILMVRSASLFEQQPLTTIEIITFKVLSQQQIQAGQWKQGLS